MSAFDWLTDDQKTVLGSRSVKISWSMRLIGWDGSDLGDHTDKLSLDRSWIGRDSSSQIQGSGTLVLKSSVDWKNSLAQLYVTIEDLYTNTEVEWRMGLWMFRAPGSRLRDQSGLWTAEIVDIIDVLGVSSGQTWVVYKSTNIGSAVEQLILIPVKGLSYDLGTISWELKDDAVWPLTENASWIDIINELLESAAHASLYSDRFGVLRTYPWRPLRDLSPIWRFSVDEPLCWLREECEREPVPASHPNKWIGINTSVENPVEGSGVFTIDKSLGERVIPHVFQVSAADQGTLQTLVSRAEQDDRLQAGRLNLVSGITPVFWHGDVVEVSMPGIGVGVSSSPVRGMVSGWRIGLSSSDMEITVEALL